MRAKARKLLVLEGMMVGLRVQLNGRKGTLPRVGEQTTFSHKNSADRHRDRDEYFSLDMISDILFYASRDSMCHPCMIAQSLHVETEDAANLDGTLITPPC